MFGVLVGPKEKQAERNRPLQVSFLKQPALALFVNFSLHINFAGSTAAAMLFQPNGFIAILAAFQGQG